MVDRRQLLLICTLCIVTLWAGTCSQALAQRKPNVILIMADDLGYETLGCNGNTDKLTPRLDGLAASGMRFTHGYSTPLCTPSRVQLMTGKYNHRNYIGFGLLDPAATTFGHLMQQQGYKTCIAGKWQLYGNEQQRQLAGGKVGTLPQHAGFDRFCLWQVDTLGSRYRDPTVYTDAGTSVTLPGDYGPDVFTRYVSSFIEEHRDEPFFVYYPMCLTHDPFEPTPSSADYNRAVRPDPRYFKDMVSYMDRLVGQLVDKVDELGLLEETVFIFVGDNGTSRQIVSNFNGEERRGNKGYTTSGGTHVPLLVSWKNRIKPGSINPSLVDFTDFLPTLLELAGASGASPGLDGVSFYPQLLGDFSTQREWIFCHYAPGWGNFEPSTFAQDTTWKVYQTGEIYNLRADLEETIPISLDGRSEAEQAQIRKLQSVIQQLYNH